MAHYYLQACDRMARNTESMMERSAGIVLMQNYAAQGMAYFDLKGETSAQSKAFMQDRMGDHQLDSEMHFHQRANMRAYNEFHDKQVAQMREKREKEYEASLRKIQEEANQR